jgi:uncharacterized protein YcgI (DUF1989 family)
VARKPSESRERIDLRAERDLIVRINRMRNVWGETISQYIRRAVIERLQKDEAAYVPPPKGRA